MPERVSKTIFVAVVVAVITSSTAPWWWDQVIPDSRPTGPVTGTVVEHPSPTGHPTGGGTTPATGGVDSVPVPAGCTITVTNPFATLTDPPDPVNAGSNRVPAGTYTVQATTLVEFGRTERWFKITAGGRTGWIRDEIVFIAAKSEPCP